MKPLLFFDGTNVMLIRESDVLNKDHYPIEMYEGREAYSKALEAAKKKAIKVDNAFCSNHKVCDIHLSKTMEVITEDAVEGQTYPLPEGYSYEMHKSYCTEIGCDGMRPCGFDYGDSHSCGHYVTCIIKPIAQPESEDELWRELSEIAWDDPTIYTLALKNMKSKYHLTRKP